MIQSAIKNLYRVFSVYALADEINGCPHCELDDLDHTLHSKSLQTLEWDDFGVYPFKAMTTFGDLEDFKHFLPRLVDLYINDYDSATYDFDVFLSKLEYGKWETWPMEESKAIKTCISDWLESVSGQVTDQYEQSIYDEISEALESRGLSSKYKES